MSGALRSAADAAAWLEGLIDVERQWDVAYERLGLGPIRALLARLGDPQDGLRVLHLAGSKGKGSTALLAEAVLRAGGLRTGVFTSPHLESWTERFRIDGRPVSGDRLAAAVERLRPHVDALRGDPATAPTWFDATTAAALLLFAEAGVDLAVLEVGLGGRLDSTNAVDPALTCITTIELEHTDKLGHTHEAIAAEKAGILKRGRPLVLGALGPGARAVVEARARELGVPVHRLGDDFGARLRAEAPGSLDLSLRDGPVEIETRLPVSGAHQAENAALAVACVRRLGVFADERLPELVERGFAGVDLPGRIEILSREPWVVVDAAHTAASARALAAVLAQIPRRRTELVLSVSAGKDLPAILDALLPQADRATVTRAEPTRSLAPDEVAAAVRRAAPGLEVRAVPNPQLALRAAREAAAPDTLVCATGSIYLAGLARRLLRPADPGRSPLGRPAAPGPIGP